MARKTEPTVLAINAGSSSLKAALITKSGEKVATFLAEKLNCDDAVIIKTTRKQQQKTIPIPRSSHEEALDIVVRSLREMDWLDSLVATGHRVVHGGNWFTKSTVIDGLGLDRLESLHNLAPLHNPHNVAGIHAAIRCFKYLPVIAVFDTAFHASIPAMAKRYPIPKEYGDIQKYGFHGTSVRYVSSRVAQYDNVIVCHLGNGASVTAVSSGNSVETSMGFSPATGLMMGTRSGDIDPAIFPYALEHLGKTVGEVMNDLNGHSGLKAIANRSDMREVLRASTDPQCCLAVDMFVYRVVKFIAVSAVALSGATNAIVFTAGIGEHSPIIRKACLERLQATIYPDLVIDDERNNDDGRTSGGEITTKGSIPVAFVIPTDEEAMIAIDSFELAENQQT